MYGVLIFLVGFPKEACGKQIYFLEARGRENSTSVAGTEDENLRPTREGMVEPPFWDLRRRRRRRFIATQPPSKYVDSIQAFDVSKCMIHSGNLQCIACI
jgi:hypothetical protein